MTTPDPERLEFGDKRRCRSDTLSERNTVRVAPVGEVETATGRRARGPATRTGSGFRRFVPDLRWLTFMDSSRLQPVFDWDARARRDGMSLAVIPGPPVVQRVFEIAGVIDRLAPRRDRKSAAGDRDRHANQLQA